MMGEGRNEWGVDECNVKVEGGCKRRTVNEKGV